MTIKIQQLVFLLDVAFLGLTLARFEHQSTKVISSHLETIFIPNIKAIGHNIHSHLVPYHFHPQIY